MFTSRLLGRILATVPGKETFGIYRHLPFFFFLGAGLEYTMIKWQPKGHNFLLSEDMGQWRPYLKFMAAAFLAYAAGSQAVHLKYKPLSGFQEKVNERAEEIKRERNELLYGSPNKPESS